ncbi:MAG: MBL fold metallo-hydrolase [Candidatus Paceibacterota bacterium]|jgi:metallo-beta-lactamase family protein
MQKKKATIYFHSGAGTVTGANFRLVGDEGTQILLDCGMLQGSKVADDKNWDPFPYEPKDITALFVSHPHIDHVGRIARLVRMGFTGTIYSTAPCKDIGLLLLEDSLGVIEKECVHDCRLEPLYAIEDVKKAETMWKTLDYHQTVKVGDYNVLFRDAGHVLGSAMTEVECNGTKLLYTGDLGNSPSPIMHDTEIVKDATYLIMESTYGNRNHEHKEERAEKLKEIIQSTINLGGTLMIPAFSVERTQELLYEVNEMFRDKKLAPVTTYLDSPLAIKVTAVYEKYKNMFNDQARADILKGDIFKFPGLKMTMTTDESRAILHDTRPKIIIAGSGMSNGGRIIHHERIYLPDPKNTLLLVSYQSAGTLGRVIQDGAKGVRILGEMVPVRAQVVSLPGYSAHKDSDGLFNFVEQCDGNLQKVFVALGEPASALFMVQRIRDYLGYQAYAPSAGEKAELEF